jgi:hypothetical protein
MNRLFWLYNGLEPKPYWKFSLDWKARTRTPTGKNIWKHGRREVKREETILDEVKTIFDTTDAEWIAVVGYTTPMSPSPRILVRIDRGGGTRLLPPFLTGKS